MIRKRFAGQAAVIFAAKAVAIGFAMFLVTGSVANADSSEDLIESVKQRHAEDLRVLLGLGADVNARDDKGATALMWACALGHTGVVKILLNQKADVHAKDEKGATALMWAAARGHTGVVKILLSHGADVNARDEDGATALMQAAARGHTGVVELLKDHGAQE